MTDVTRESLTAALHHAMCDVSHHDSMTVCKNQRKYELIAESVCALLSQEREALWLCSCGGVTPTRQPSAVVRCQSCGATSGLTPWTAPASLSSPAPEPPPLTASQIRRVQMAMGMIEPMKREEYGRPGRRTWKDVDDAWSILLDVTREPRATQPALDLDPTQIGFQEMVTLLDRWLQANYPPDVFDGSSGDEGAVFVTRLRRAMGELGRSRIEALEKLADSHARSVLSKSEARESGGEP